MGYTILSQVQARKRLGDDLTNQLARLTELAFGHFEGVIRPSLPTTRWYLQRPGMDETLSGVALVGEQAVSSVYVTRVTFPVGGRSWRIGLIDTVMTDPAHRRRGLARRLLHRALKGLKTKGADGAALYAVPNSGAYQLYQDLGFRIHRHSLLWSRSINPDLPMDVSARQAEQNNASALRSLLNATNRHKDGFVQVDAARWRWRRDERPPTLPTSTFIAGKGNHPTATVTASTVERVGAVGLERCTYLLDLALPSSPAAASAHLRSLLSAVGQAAIGQESRRYVTLTGRGDLSLEAPLTASGFQPSPAEPCLLLPFHDQLKRAMTDNDRPWHVLVASVVGI